MSDVYRLFGLENSPYSVKVRSYLRYKGIPHEWIVRSGAAMEEFRRHAKLPLVPLLVGPDGEALQDSTPILETLEQRFPQPAIAPPSPGLAFLSELLEEFGDEWGNKWMFHLRWARPADQQAAAARLVAESMPGAGAEQQQAMAGPLRERMIGRVWFVGSNPDTAPLIEASWAESVALLEAHLGAGRAYLFGGRPALADFGLWGQIYSASLDPTPAALLRERAPALLGWVERMLDPKAAGGFESLAALAPTLRPLLAGPVARWFLPWSDANARAIDAGNESFDVELCGQRWSQKPQKYHAKSLAELRRKYAALAERSECDPLLRETGCLDWLR